MKKLVLFISILLNLCSVNLSQAQTLNYLGKHFIFDTRFGITYPPNKLYIFGDKQAIVSFLDSAGNVLAQVNKAAFTFDSIDYPFCCNNSGGWTVNPTFSISSTDSVIVYECRADAYAAMHAIPPQNISGTVSTYNGHPQYIWSNLYDKHTFAYIMSTNDSIIVNIYPNQPHPLLVNPPFFSVTIPPFHAFYDEWHDDYTGSIIQTDTSFSNGTFQVHSGDVAAISSSADYLIPKEFLKQEYHTIPHLTRAGDRIHVIPFEDSTTVMLYGNPIVLNKGQIIDTLITLPTTWKADKKIEVIELSRSWKEDTVVNSSSFAYPMFPDANTFTRAQFATLLYSDSVGLILQNYLNILAPTNGTQTVTLDGNSLSTFFSVFPDDSLWSFAQLPIASGMHTILADSGVVTYLYGYGQESGFGTIIQGFEMKNNVTALYENTSQKNNILVSPNPSSDIVSVNLDDHQTNVQLILTDISGKNIPINYFKSNDHTFKIRVNNLPDGIYLLQIKNSKGGFCRKIVVQHL